MLSRSTRVLAVSLVLAAGSARSSATAQVPGQAIGRVIDAANGRPIAAARVDVAERGVHTESDADGRFVLRGLEPRRYTVHLRALGYLPYDGDFEIANGRATTIDIALHAIATRLDPLVARAARDSASHGAVTIERRAIEASGRRDVGELLQTVPGVVVTQAGGPGSPAHVSIRGSSASEVLVLVDGSPVNSVMSGDADLSRISLERVERITVLRGASSARYGGHALAGVVLIETRDAENDASVTAATGAWGERAGGGTLGGSHWWNDTRLGGSLTVDRRSTNGNFDYAVPAVRGGGMAERVNSDAATSSVAAGATLTSGRVEAHLRLDGEATERGLSGSIVQPSITGRGDERRTSAGIDSRVGLGRLTWSTNANLAREHAHLADPEPPFGGRYDDELTATEVRLSTEMSAAGSFGSASVGAETRALGIHSTALDTAAPPRQRLTGAWTTLHFAHALSARTALGADAGARLDWDSLIRGIEVSPRVGLTLSHSVLALSASAGNGYSPPSLADQFFHEGVLVQPNPGLAPERVRGETELRASLRDVHVATAALSGELAVYRADVRGMILWAPDFRFVWSPSNFDVRRAGLEASGRLAIPVGASTVDVQGTLNQVDVTYTGSVLSGQVAYRPRTTASVRVGTTHGSLRADLETRYVGSRRTVAGAATNLLDPYWLTDATLGIPILRRAWDVDAITTITNLFDRPAAMLVDYPFAGRGWRLALRARRAHAGGR